MNTDIFFNIIRNYTALSSESEKAWANLLVERVYSKGEYLVPIGQIPRKVAFVLSGLFSQYFISEEGDMVIKYFFPEGRIAGSIPATLTQTKSLFAIEALEITTVLEYDYLEFKKLVGMYPDIAAFYIHYIEKHWIVEKEPLEVALKNETAAKQYSEFLKKYPDLIKRLKKHQIAAYLGITPTQLSRVFGYSK